MSNDRTIMRDGPWGLRVRELRIKAGMTQDDLATAIGTTKATISKIERSTGSPKMDWIERLAPALNTKVATLALGEDKSVQLGLQRVPVIGMIAAGNWREAVQVTDESILVPNAKAHMFALKIDGDSVDRVAPHGAYVSIDPTDGVLTDGDLFAVQNGSGDATLKRFRRSPDRLEPDSTNPMHKPLMLGSEPITVIGRATSITQIL